MMNPCNEISITTNKLTSLGSDHYWETRTHLTYPTVTQFGIKEMTRSQQHAYYEKFVMTNSEKNNQTRQHVLDMEDRMNNMEVELKILRQMIAQIQKITQNCLQPPST